MEHYQGRKAVIIGGTSGMGLATAKMLLDRGARVLGRSTEDGLNSKVWTVREGKPASRTVFKDSHTIAQLMQ